MNAWYRFDRGVSSARRRRRAESSQRLPNSSARVTCSSMRLSQSSETRTPSSLIYLHAIGARVAAILFHEVRRRHAMLAHQSVFARSTPAEAALHLEYFTRTCLSFLGYWRSLIMLMSFMTLCNARSRISSLQRCSGIKRGS